MRQGEIDNCLVMTNPDRCLFPLRQGGVHHASPARRAAFDAFAKLADREPDNLEVRWLLNLVGMLLGRYPEGVPAQHLLRPDLFRSEGADAAVHRRRARRPARHQQHRRRHDRRRLRRRRPARHRPDVSVDYCAPVRLYRNNGDGTFEDRTEAAGLAAQLGGLNASQPTTTTTAISTSSSMRGGWEIRDAQLAAAQQRRRHVHRRDARRPAWPTAYSPRTRRRGPTTTTTAGSTSTSATSWRRASSFATAATARSRTCRPRAGVGRQRLHQGRRRGATTTTTASRPLRLEHVRRQPPLPQQRRRHVRPRSRRSARRAEAVRQLPDLVLRLRQRRPARPLRRRRTRTRSRSSSSTTSASRRRPRR